MGSAGSHDHPSTFLEPTTATALKAKQEREANPDSLPSSETATVATGCFWGPDYLVGRQYGNGKGLLHSQVGYTGGHAANPNYRQVCGGGTGHAEAVQVKFDPRKVSYAEMIEFFMRTHDATDAGGQGGDRGSTYRSAMFYHDQGQKETLESLFKDLKADKRYGGKPIATKIEEAGTWWKAEGYHQDYLEENPGGYHCPAHRPYW